MLDFVIQKMLNRKWIVICLLIGNILMISVAGANPMYTDAIQIKSLNREISNYIEEKNDYPGTVTVDASLTVENGSSNIESFNEGLETFNGMEKKFGLDNFGKIYHYYLPKADGLTENYYGDVHKKVEMAVGYMSDFPEHISIVSGEMYSDKINSDGSIDAVISQKALVAHKLVIGEVITFEKIVLSGGEPLKIKITGVFENSEEDDLYWVNSPNELISEVFISEKVFTEQFIDFEKPKYSLRSAYYLLLDCSKMRENVISGLLEDTQWYVNKFSEKTDLVFRANYVSLLEEHTVMMHRVKSTLRILQIPVMILLVAFIFMVSQQILEIEKNDIAILKSRGAGKKQILHAYLLQSLILAGAGIVIGLPISAIICQMFGSSNAFLSFVSRGALSLRLTWSVLLWVILAAFICVVAMIVPVFAYAKTSIVEHKQKKNSLKAKPAWKKYYLDFVMALVSVYGFINFTRQKAALAEAVAEGGALDPLLYLCSSLFIIGFGLILLRLLPLILKLAFNIFKPRMKPPVYAASLKMLRSFNKQNFIMIFLILTLALGIFNAKAAHTINYNEEKSISYKIGADVVLQETWPQVGDLDDIVVAEGESEELNAVDYVEPDFDKYKTIDGVKNAARVYTTDNARISMTIDLSNVNQDDISAYEDDVKKAYYESNGKLEEYTTERAVKLMGIHTKDFGNTAWFDTALLPKHWYHYLNAISQNSSAILVSENFHSLLGYQLGDTLTYRTATGGEIKGTIFGFVEYWPTYNPETAKAGENGEQLVTPNFLIVANLAKIQEKDGILPYEVWLDVEGSTQPIYDFIGDKEIALDYFEDIYAEKIDMKNKPMIQGTNGILTMGFIIVLILCAVGLLIYWIISVQSRSLQFGIFRAMGMTSKDIIVMLLCEQAIIVVPTIAAGTVLGFVTSELFVPLIQIAYASTELTLPLTMAGAFGDILKMFIAVIIAVVICVYVVNKLVDMVKISQALKLGED